MRDWMFGMWFGIALGSIGMAVIVSVFGPGKLWEQQTNEDMLRDYDAYRECIPKPHCMKAADFIDYYDLKWRLQAIEKP